MCGRARITMRMFNLILLLRYLHRDIYIKNCDMKQLRLFELHDKRVYVSRGEDCRSRSCSWNCHKALQDVSAGHGKETLTNSVASFFTWIRGFLQSQNQL